MTLVPLGEIADIQLGKMLSPKAKTGEASFPYLRNQNVQWGKIKFGDLAYMDFSDREREKFSLRSGDLLVCEGGEPGRCAIWNGERTDCYYQKALHRVRPHTGKADPEFLSLWIRYQAYTGSFEDQNAKTTIAHLPLVRLQQLLVPDVSVQEQRRIAACLKAQLATLEDVRQAAQLQLKDAQRLIPAILETTFSNVDHWPVVPLREAGQIVAGITMGRKTKETVLTPVPYLRVANVQDGHLNLTEMKTVEATQAEIKKWQLRRGDLLLTEGGDLDKLGRGACWDEQLPVCIHQNHIFRVRFPADRFVPEFVAMQIGSAYGKAYFFAHAKKTTGIASINQQVLGSFPLLAPPLKVQKSIVATISKQVIVAGELLWAASQQIADIDRLPTRLLAQAFENITHG